MSAAASLRIHACAKINLTLRVLGIHADGYHELRTTFQSLALHDTLTFTAARGPFTLTSDSRVCPTDETNLVWKAAERLWAEAGRRGAMPGVRVHITKRVPVQAGLGGGSSDGAAALRALRLLWRLRVSDAHLEALARDLGADVAFFLEGGTALGVERGDLLFPLLDAPPGWVVVARPDFGVSTKEAYGWWDEAFLAARGGTREASQTALVGRVVSRQSEWVNDLQAPVAARHPRILELIRKLERRGARFAAMSGSGSAVFGLFDGRSDAEVAAQQLSGSATRTWLTRTTTRRQHARSSAPIAI